MNDQEKQDMIEFENAFTNGVYVEPFKLKKGYVFKAREAIKKVEELGRPLTDEEMNEFEVISSN